MEVGRARTGASWYASCVVDLSGLLLWICTDMDKAAPVTQSDKYIYCTNVVIILLVIILINSLKLFVEYFY